MRFLKTLCLVVLLVLVAMPAWARLVPPSLVTEKDEHLVQAATQGFRSGENVLLQVENGKLVVTKMQVVVEGVSSESFPLPDKKLVGNKELLPQELYKLIANNKTLKIKEGSVDPHIFQSHFPYFLPRYRLVETHLSWGQNGWQASQKKGPIKTSQATIVFLAIALVCSLLFFLNIRITNTDLLIGLCLFVCALLMSLGIFYWWGGLEWVIVPMLFLSILPMLLVKRVEIKEFHPLPLVLTTLIGIIGLVVTNLEKKDPSYTNEWLSAVLAVVALSLFIRWTFAIIFKLWTKSEAKERERLADEQKQEEALARAKVAQTEAACTAADEREG